MVIRSEVECSVAAIYEEMWNALNTRIAVPPSSSIHLKFPGKNGKPDVKLTLDGWWYYAPNDLMNLGPDEAIGRRWDGGVIIEGTKGKMMCGCYGANPNYYQPQK